MPAVFGSSDGSRLPTSPPRAEEDGWAGPDMPKGWFGRSGAALGFSKRAIRSRSDPETIRCRGCSPDGEDERESPAGGVRLGGVGLWVSVSDQWELGRKGYSYIVCCGNVGQIMGKTGKTNPRCGRGIVVKARRFDA